MPQFQPDDVVRLKVGGPHMTVIGLSRSSGKFICQWRDRNTMTAATFAPDVLEAVEIGPSEIQSLG